MKNLYITVILILSAFSAAYAQKTIDYAVRVSATVQKAPASIRLSWPKDSNVVNYFIYRKLKTDPKFPAIAINTSALSASDTTFTDKTVSVGINYEYELVKTIAKTAYYGFGYISSGIELPVTEARGKLILLVDNNFLPTLQPEIARLVLDMTNDGWSVIMHGVNKTDKVTDVHALIEADYTHDPANVKAVFLLGHIPVPYSGGSLVYGLNPIDGHKPQHEGAWPADIYYADMHGTWTDTNVTDTLGEYKANHNVPGDGKFDQDVIPGNVDLEVGRVDMYDMPDFAPLTETGLMKRYLDKDHNWRMGLIKMNQQGLVMDYFGIVRNDTTNHLSDEAFAACGYKNFSAMFGAKNVVNSGSWETDLTASSYLWSYGCGGGTDTSASGITHTLTFAKDSVQTVFTMIFGSWFGDWNNTNNYLRAPLASKGPILTNCWSGRPQWQFHNMAMGDNIGYSMLINANDNSNGPLDYTNYFKSAIMSSNDRMIHVALMGDPTLRMHVVQPPSNLSLSNNKLVVTLNWTASTEPGLLGYNVYRSKWIDQPFEKISGPTPISGTTFVDNSAMHHTNFYMVRAVKLETSASGSYFNMSQGTMDTLTTDNSGIEDIQLAHSINVYPNPTQNIFHIVWPGSETSTGMLHLFDIVGNEVLSMPLSGMVNLQTIDVNMTSIAKGVYTLKINNGDAVYVQRIVRD